MSPFLIPWSNAYRAFSLLRNCNRSGLIGPSYYLKLIIMVNNMKESNWCVRIVWLIDKMDGTMCRNSAYCRKVVR